MAVSQLVSKDVRLLGSGFSSFSRAASSEPSLQRQSAANLFKADVACKAERPHFTARRGLAMQGCEEKARLRFRAPNSLDRVNQNGLGAISSPGSSKGRRKSLNSMHATGTDSKERTDQITDSKGRTDQIVTPAEEAAARLGVNGADYLNDPNKERGRSPVPEGVHPSVQLLVDVLKEEMPKFFSESGINLTIYRDDVHFQDPQNNWHTLFGFKLNVYALRFLFAKGRYLLHDIKPTGENEITARWTFNLPARFLPWTPTVILTGITKYGVDLESAKLNAHIDYWDNLAGKEQKPVSLSAIASVVKQIQPLTAFNMPRDSPHEVIRKTKAYEIRRYAMDLRDPSSKGVEVIAVKRGNDDLIQALQKGGIKAEAGKSRIRCVKSSWPHKEIEEAFVPVSYTPSVYDHVDFTGAEFWHLS